MTTQAGKGLSNTRSPRVWESARKLLCVRLDALGDVVMTTPALRALKESLPGRHITLLTSPAGAEIAGLVPEIDKVMVYEAPWMKATPAGAASATDHAMVRRLRSCSFEGAVIFTVYSQSPLPAALLCYLSDIPLRAAHCRENPYQLLTDWVADSEPDKGIRHEVRRQLDLAEAIGSFTKDETMSLTVTREMRDRVDALLSRREVDTTRPWVVVHPGASAPSRRYAPENFAKACRTLTTEYGYQIVFTGSETERELVEVIRSSMGARSHSVAGELSLPELAALLKAAPLLISNNTAPVHIAGAVGTPVVDLYALTNPQHTPWGVPNRVLFHDVPCKYCYKSICPMEHHNCLRLVPPRSIVTAARELLDGPPAAAEPT